MSQELNVNSKRRASDEIAQSPSQIFKKVTESKNQPRINDFLSQKPLRISESLPNLDQTNDLEKTLIAENILSIEANSNQHLNIKMSTKGDDAKKLPFLIPTQNKFELLNNVDLSSNANNNNSKQPNNQKNKIPPITVVGAINFAKSMEILNTVAPNADYSIKYMSVGTKIMIKAIEVYDVFKKSLNEADVEFYSHDVQSMKIDRFILSGIARIPFKEIMESLKLYQIEPYEIREFIQKTKKFEDEGAYIVSFKHGTTKLQNLNKTVINYTVPKWRPFLKTASNITQCRRCQLFGHGMRNCNMQFKCSNCGLDHPSDNCKSPVTKCANCKGDHNSTSPSCPKRKEFTEMRSSLAASNNKKPAKSTPAPRKDIKNFPELPKRSSKNPTATTDALQSNQPTTTNWSSMFNSGSSKGANTATNKFQVNEINQIMSEILIGLSKCQNKEQQLILMFEMAAKYIYNVGP